MKETVTTYTTLFQELQENLGTQGMDLDNLIRKIDSHIERLTLTLENEKQYFRPNSLYLITLNKMLNTLSTYKARCVIIAQQVGSSMVDIDETLTTNEWVLEAIATKERVGNEST